LEVEGFGPEGILFVFNSPVSDRPL